MTDTHVDRGGFALVVGVTVLRGQEHLIPVADAILATWRWLDP